MKVEKNITVEISSVDQNSNRMGSNIDSMTLSQKIANYADNIVALVFKKQFIHLRMIVADNFYKSYYPRYYQRHHSLKYMMYPYIEDYEFQFDLGIDTPIYHAWHPRTTEQYLYMNTFEQGYHGGHRSGPGHPARGIPYWRTPHPTYESWGKPAVLAEISPHDDIIHLWDSFVNVKGQDIRKNAIQTAFKFYHNEIKKYLISLINGGEQK